MKHVLLTLLFCFAVVLSACDEMTPTQEIDTSSEINDIILENDSDETTPTDDDQTSNEQEQEILDDNSSTIDLCVGGCPQLAPPSSDWCKDGDRVSRQPDECGCTGTPLCLDKEYCAGMSYADAWRVALQSECVDEHVLNVSDYVCNEGTSTWWIDLLPNKEGCNPACVVSAHTETAEINWRCTGALP